MLEAIGKYAGDGFYSKIDNPLNRLYPLLPDFTIEVTGLYSYLRSWKNNEEGSEYYGCAWPSKGLIKRQCNLTEHKFNKYMAVLKRYDLIRVKKSRITANKNIYEIIDPLTTAEFVEKYSDHVKGFLEDIEEIRAENESDLLRLASFQRQKKTVELRLAEAAKEEDGWRL